MIKKKLEAFYNTIERPADSSDPSAISGKSVQLIPQTNEYVTYDQESLLSATQCIIVNRAIGNNSSLHALSSLIAKNLLSVFANDPENIQMHIMDLVGTITKMEPKTMNVYMPIHGMSISKREKVGEFEFIPENAPIPLDINVNSPLLTSLLQDQVWRHQNHIMVSVTACDSAKAKEKACAEFQWLENAVRLFVDKDISDFGITSFNSASSENSLVTSTEGKALGTSLQVKGVNFPLSFEDAFHPTRILYCVVDKLGHKQDVLTPMQRRIRHATYLGGLSAHETVPEIAFFLCVSALEALFQVDDDKYVNPSIAQQIIEAFCFLVVDEKDRRTTFEQLRPLYGKRSTFAHGGKTRVSPQDLKLVQTYLRMAIVKLICDPILSKCNIDALFHLVRDKKFGQ